MKNILMNTHYRQSSYFLVVFFCMLSFESSCTKNFTGGSFNYKGKYTSDIDNYEIVVPQRVNEDGNFISHVVSHQHSKRSTKEREMVFYKIPIEGKEYLIELTPNRKLISPGAVVETHKIIFDSNNSSQTMTNSTREKFGKIYKNLNLKKLKNAECHFSGHVKGENISKAALSTCYGLAGFIQIAQGLYTIEPVAEHDPFVEDAFPHMLYKSNTMNNDSFCRTTGDYTSILSNNLIREKRESNVGSSTPMYMETLLVMDKNLINYHKESDCENYVLTVFNMAFNLFHDASLGLIMTPTIVRIIRLEVENNEMNLKVNNDAVKTFQYFQNWQYEINPGDDSHPNHHDVAVFLTRSSYKVLADVCYSPSSYGLLGLSTVGKACDPKYSAVLCEDNGLRLGFIIAHEIGHLLGADHDSINSTCNGTSFGDFKTIMHPQVSLNSQTWSKCSQAHFKAFFKSGLGNCFLDEPEDHHFNVQDLLPGVMYNADFQCKHLIAANARECDRGSSCDSLNCYVPKYACILTHTSPADGTRCGEGMWCHDEKCIVVGQRPGAIDGNWGEWSSWSDCTRTCGSGVASSVRQCDKPLPSHGGKNCVDLIRFISDEVNVSFVGQPCKTGRPSFRDVQCGEFDDWIYPEDGKKHTWRAFYQHEDNPCKLYCINEKKTVAALRPRVVDGTMCYRGIRDICIGGMCKTLPCDLHFESNAIEDVCGVCHGDGTGCEFSGGTEYLTKSSRGVTKLLDVPSGTRNIRVEEMSTTSAKIVVKDKESKDVYVQGTALGMYNVPGSQAWLGMVKKNQEALCIPGPISKPISIWIQRQKNVTVKWSMALPPIQQRKPEFAWDFMKWGPCSARCGPGTQKSEPSCMEEKAGLVESTFCVDLEMPPAKVRSCQVTKCEPRWMVGDWRGCEKPLTAGKVRKRVVYCIKPMGEGEGESEIVSDSECHEAKPHETEPCENRQKRENTEYNSQASDDSAFISDRAEFGFHKKYDDYLTHFAALSAPQRKSETVPLHLLSSPHFKHYFRVLETPENNANDGFDGNILNSTVTDRQNQNKVSPDFYKNTFSGNPIDVSHMQSQLISIKARKNAPIENSNTDDNYQGNKITKNIVSRKRIKERSGSVLQIKKKLLKSLNSKEFKTKNTLNDNQKTNQMKQKRNKPFMADFNTNCDDVNSLPCFWKHSKKRNSDLKSKRIRHSIRDIFLKKRVKSFNYTSPNLTDIIIDNLGINNINIKNHFVNFIRGEKGFNASFSENEKRSEGNDSPWNQRGSESIVDEPINTQEIFSKEPNKFDEESRLNKNDDSIDTEEKLKKIKMRFDGSGIKKLNCSHVNRFDKETDIVLNKKMENLHNQKNSYQERKNFVSHSLLSDSLKVLSAKPKFKGGYRSIEDLFLSNKNRKLQSKTLKKRNTCFFVPNEMLKEFLLHHCETQSSINFPRRKIRKRLSRKWKKQKLKDLSLRGNKDCGANGCGTETRNYLNNLFRDTRGKVTPKPDPPETTEETVINTGQLIIDHDLVDDQLVDVVAQEDYEEESLQNYGTLPRPSLNQKITLQGQQVFDFYQQLRKGSEPYSSSQNNSDQNMGKKDDDDKIEVGVKLPCRSQTTESPNDATRKSDETVENDINEAPDVDLIVEDKIDSSSTTESMDYESYKSAINFEDYTLGPSQIEEPLNLASTFSPIEGLYSSAMPQFDNTKAVAPTEGTQNEHDSTDRTTTENSTGEDTEGTCNDEDYEETTPNTTKSPKRKKVKDKGKCKIKVLKCSQKIEDAAKATRSINCQKKYDEKK